MNQNNLKQIKFNSDESTIDDNIGHHSHVKILGDMIESYDPPVVIGIHGDWGAGKTSFLKKLRFYLSGKNNPEYKDLKLPPEWGENHSANVETIWFDAWRYQFEPNPIIALLNEIRAHFTLTQKFAGKAAKLTYAALMSIEELTKKIGISAQKIAAAGEKWEQSRMTQPLPSDLCKDLLEDAIGKLLDNSEKSRKRLIIFVDDLDRCMGEVAFRFLESIKIYLSISNCTFILGLDVRHIRRAVASELKKTGMIAEDENKEARCEVYASDYLNKMFQFIFYLPNITDFKTYLETLMDDKVFGDEEPTYINTIIEYKLLPPNPRKIKLFINGLMFYLNHLKMLKPEQPLDHKLVLIFAYLKFMANDIYRLVEAEKGDFWDKLVEFCRTSQHGDNWALKKFTLPEKAEAKGEEYDYSSAFPDPSDESLFRCARLIREWQDKTPTEDQFNLYLLRS